MYDTEKLQNDVRPKLLQHHLFPFSNRSISRTAKNIA